VGDRVLKPYPRHEGLNRRLVFRRWLDWHACIGRFLENGQHAVVGVNVMGHTVRPNGDVRDTRVGSVLSGGASSLRLRCGAGWSAERG
jgi:hypothetical protein